MPPLDVSLPAVIPQLPLLQRTIHPDTTKEPLRLEARSAIERSWWGHRFGIDTPYMEFPLGWGESAPLYGVDMLQAPWFAVAVVPMPQAAGEPPFS